MCPHGMAPGHGTTEESVERTYASRVPLAWLAAQGGPRDELMRGNPSTAPPADATLRGAPDETLVAEARQGRREAFDVLVERHQRHVYQACYRLLGTHEDAADATQDAFLRAYRGLDGFRGQSAFRTWLYRVAVNVAFSRTARADDQAAPIERAEHLAAAGEPPDVALDRTARAAAVRAAVARLPPRQRLTLVLRVYHDLSHEEIARVLGRSVGTVKANLFFAMRNLKARLRPGGEQ
jgi:RNA polymerase sigma-70 factor (ECF subfamily)